jgi:hypothetical protein
MVEFVYRLLNCPNYLPDSMRDYKVITSDIGRILESAAPPVGICDSGGKLCGVFCIIDITPGHQARFVCWIWDKEAFSHNVFKAIEHYIGMNMAEMGLRRMVCQTPDESLCELLKRLGFKIEGRFKSGYKSGGKFHLLYQLRKLAD